MVEGEGDPWEGPQALSEQHMSPVLFLTLNWNNNFLHVTLQIQERKVKLCQTVPGKPWESHPQGSKASCRRECVWATTPQMKPGTSEHGESWVV